MEPAPPTRLAGIEQAVYECVTAYKYVDANCLARLLSRDSAEVEAAFLRFDADRSGAIERGELQRALARLGLPSSDDYVDDVFSQYDTDGSGAIDLREFKGYVAKKERAMWQAFRGLDVDASGAITSAELEGAVPADQQGDDLEAQAKEQGMAYVKLDGDIGIMGNGAGLVMSTLDVVDQAGGKAANFFDAGGGADAESMGKGIAFVLADPSVKVMLINIFGGITRCDDVANGVLGAMEMLGDVDQKIVVRLDGNAAEEGRRILEEANNPNIIPATQMIEAAEKAVAILQEG